MIKNKHTPEQSHSTIKRVLRQTFSNRLSYYNEEQIDAGCSDRASEICKAAESLGIVLGDVSELTKQRDALKQQRDDLLVAQQWQPINTAPKEGLFLVHRKHTAYPIVAHVYKPYGSICDYVFGELLHNVTHWMPLPPAPAIATVKEG